MVRSIGIDPGGRAVNVVALDGNYRKVRLVGVSSTAMKSGDDPLRRDMIATAVREALDGGMKGEITLGHPCREAVLRTIELPFKGSDAIKKVVKSEIEGEIFTHSVDDMVVDFHEIGEAPSGGTKLLVAAVPKLGLRNQLACLSAQSVEPESVDLDTMALWRVADWAGAFDATSDEGDDADEDGAVQPVHAVVDLGARSVKVILTEGDQLVEMRVLRLGDSVVSEQVARVRGLDVEQVCSAMDESLRTGGDVRVGVAEQVDNDTLDTAATEDSDGDSATGEVFAIADVDAEDSEAEPTSGDAVLAASEAQTELVTYSEFDAAHTKYMQRLARELTRFLAASGMASRIRSVWMSGVASRGRGVSEMLGSVFGVAPQELDVLQHLSHDLDEQEAAESSPRLAIAVGLALGRLGGPEGFELRQEDLVLTGGFDRIKFPLAIACMVGLLTLFVVANKKSMELKKLELELGQEHVDPNDPDKVSFHGHLNKLFQGRWLRDKNYFSLKKGKQIVYSYDDLIQDVKKAPVASRLKLVLDKLKRVAAQKQKESGVYEDVALESGLAVLVRWSEVMKSIEPELGRYLVPKLAIDMKSRKITFSAGFRGEDFRARKAVIERAFTLEIGKPDSPFTGPERGSGEPKESPFKDRTERGVAGAYFDFTWDIKEQFLPFGPSKSLGALLEDGSLVQPARDYLALHTPRFTTEGSR